MSKVNIIADILKKFHDPAATDVIVDDGAIMQTAPRSLSFTKEYIVTIGLENWCGDENILFSHLIRFLRDHEKDNQAHERFKYEVLFLRDTEVYLAIEIKITDRISVEESGEDIYVDVC